MEAMKLQPSHEEEAVEAEDSGGISHKEVEEVREVESQTISTLKMIQGVKGTSRTPPGTAVRLTGYMQIRHGNVKPPSPAPSNTKPPLKPEKQAQPTRRNRIFRNY